jgi:hypothetical protein
MSFVGTTNRREEKRREEKRREEKRREEKRLYYRRRIVSKIGYIISQF